MKFFLRFLKRSFKQHTKPSKTIITDCRPQTEDKEESSQFNRRFRDDSNNQFAVDTEEDGDSKQ